ncbi:hypothetical protein RJT34_26531 [Clitoria ternatea]|uniref:Peroxidase n=1 Tax=Clitoria ternatea TaxID=43366 RepID=A0AAN9FBG3_CLITE
MASNPLSLFIIFPLVLAFHFHASEAQDDKVLIEPALSFNFHAKTCPQLENIVRNHLQKVFKTDNGQAPGLLRIFFHDCFVTGCDGSLLLDAITAGGQSERDQPANGGMRNEALNTIEELRRQIHSKCGKTVSCSDITALAARDAVFLSGGPNFALPLGRRDGFFIKNLNETNKLPSPFEKTDTTIKTFAAKIVGGKQVFDVTDVVAFSGAHTFGRAHCGSFFNRLNPVDPNMDKTLATSLKATCPTAQSFNTANLDVRTPTVFDNKYYIDVLNRQGVFTSDHDLINDQRTKGLVSAFARDQKLFFDKFVNAMVKLSQLGVLTGNQGEIRDKCNLINNKKSMLKSVVEEVVDFAEQL